MALSALNCTRCGAPLQDEPEGALVRCGYCGQNHHFNPKPPAPLPVAAPVPTGVFRLWMVPIVVAALGLLSSVVMLLTMRAPLPSAATPGGASSAEGPGDASLSYRAGEAVDVYWGSSWWPGTIKQVNAGGSYRIGYDGWSSSWDEDVSARRLRRR